MEVIEMENTHGNKSRAKRYTKEFKAGAVELVKSGRKTTEVARELGITTTSLRSWMQATEESDISEIVQIKKLEAEIKSLKRELSDKDETIDILKKATAIFTR
jgi:transposase